MKTIYLGISIVFFFIGFALGLLVYHKYCLPEIIDNRAEELNLLQYNSKVNKMVPKRNIEWNNSTDLYYLKYGTMRGWKDVY